MISCCESLERTASVNFVFPGLLTAFGFTEYGDAPLGFD